MQKYVLWGPEAQCEKNCPFICNVACQKMYKNHRTKSELHILIVFCVSMLVLMVCTRFSTTLPNCHNQNKPRNCSRRNFDGSSPVLFIFWCSHPTDCWDQCNVRPTCWSHAAGVGVEKCDCNFRRMQPKLHFRSDENHTMWNRLKSPKLANNALRCS